MKHKTMLMGSVAFICFYLGCNVDNGNLFGSDSGSGGMHKTDASDTTSSSSDSTSSTSNSSSTTTVSTSTTSTGCEPATCLSLGLNCGAIDNGCGQKLECGSCSNTESCGLIKDNICGTSACEHAVLDPTKVKLLAGANKTLYLSLFSCVCQNTNTTAACSYNTASQQMCAQQVITESFLDSDPVGQCCTNVCSVELAACRTQNY